MSWCRKALRGIWVGLLKIQIGLMLAGFLLTVSCVFIEVIFRYILLETQLFGFEELASAISVWIYFPAAAYATYEGTHLRAEITHLFLKTPQSEARWKAIISLITLGLACYVLIWSYYYFIWGLTMGEMIRIGGVIGSFPSVYSHSALFLGFNLVVLYFIVETIKHVRATFQK